MFEATQYDGDVALIDKDTFEYGMSTNGLKVVFTNDMMFIYNSQDCLLTVINRVNDPNNTNVFGVANITSIHKN
jgi:hypothetical protein